MKRTCTSFLGNGQQSALSAGRNLTGVEWIQTGDLHVQTTRPNLLDDYLLCIEFKFTISQSPKPSHKIHIRWKPNDRIACTRCLGVTKETFNGLCIPILVFTSSKSVLSLVSSLFWPNDDSQFCSSMSSGLFRPVLIPSNPFRAADPGEPREWPIKLLQINFPVHL